MLNGSGKEAPASSRARLVAISPAAPAAAQEGEGAAGGVADTPIKSGPKRMQWFVIPALTLLSAIAGGAAAWVVR